MPVLRKIKIIEADGSANTYLFGADAENINYNGTTVANALNEIGPDAGEDAIKEIFDENKPKEQEG